MGEHMEKPNEQKHTVLYGKNNPGFWLGFLGFGDFFRYDFLDFLEDFGGVVWRIFGNIFNCLLYSFGGFAGGLLKNV